MDELKLADYFAGLHREDIEAGRLDATLAGALGMAAGTAVWLSDWTLTKVRFRHAEINFQHYVKMPAILREGFALRGRKEIGLEIYWVEGWSSAAHGFCLCMKRTAKSDVYITTFHPIHFSELRRKYRSAERKGLLVRPLKTELALRLTRGASQV
ncbi:MAG: hypothetical protein ACREEP_00665 [Dongiaceae bacterium]